MIELQEDNLSSYLADNEKVIVQYGASWCGVCRIFKPKFKDFSDKNEGIAFIYVDAEKFPKSREHAEITNLPPFACFKSGELVTQKQGSNEKIIQDMIDEITGN